MLAKIRSQLTYGNVMATMAMFIALGGSSYAALTVTGKNVPKDALTGADIKNLTGKDVKNNSLDGADIKNLKTGDISNGSLLVEDFAAGQFPFLTQSQGDSRYLTSGQGDARYLTPSAGDGRYLTPSQGDSEYMPASGQIRLNAPPPMWQKTNQAGNDKVMPGVAYTTFGNTTSATSDTAVIQPTQPNVLFGEPLAMVGVNACYSTDSFSTLDTVRIQTTTNNNGVAATGAPLLFDETDRTDNNCRDYMLSTPHVLAADEDVSLEFGMDFVQNAASFGAGRATFIYQR